MPSDSSAIVELSRTIAILSKSFENGKIPKKHTQETLAAAAEQLAIAARDPDENVYHIASQVAQNAAIRSVISMGVLEEVPLDGAAISVDELAARLQFDSEFGGRILRLCASTNFFKSPAPGHYAHNALSRAFYDIDNRVLAAQVYDATAQGVIAIPAFGDSNGWKTAGDYDQGPFQLAVGTDLGYWEYLAAHPERMKSFNTGMRVGKIGRTTSAFPFGDILARTPCGENGIAIVDVGGGRGQSLEAIQEDWPLMKGRFVLQDLPNVIDDAEAKSLPPYMETSRMSFFDKQDVTGARFYYFRRIFHCWSNEKSRVILKNTMEAMDDYSRILIADMVLPDIKCSRDLASQDINMMSLGGMERSESEWRRLLESVGLVLRKVWINEDGPKHAIVEAALPTFKGDGVKVNGA